MNKLPDLQCEKCGGDTSIHFIKSTGMDITPTGMFRTCSRCGYEQSISSLDNKVNASEIEALKKSRGFSLIETLVVITIIGILSSIVLASLNNAREKTNEKANKPQQQTAQQRTQNICIEKDGVPILNSFNEMTDCKFNREEILPPCNGSDLPYNMPIEIKRGIQDARRGQCI